MAVLHHIHARVELFVRTATSSASGIDGICHLTSQSCHSEDPSALIAHRRELRELSSRPDMRRFISTTSFSVTPSLVEMCLNMLRFQVTVLDRHAIWPFRS